MKRIRFKRYAILIIILAVSLLFGQSYIEEEIVFITDEDIAMSGEVGVTPKLFGAIGDGVINDTKAVQAAIDYAAKSENYNIVFIPEGIYSVRNLRLRENVILFGQGEKSILKADPSSKTWDGILYCENLSSVDISNITFDGNKPIVAGDPSKGTVNMWINSCSNVSIKNCIFQNNWYIGIGIKNSKNLTFEENRFINLDCGILTASYPSSDIIINNNYFDGAEYSEPISIYGLKEGYHENIVITNNIIKNHTKGSGILIRAVKNVTVSGNIIDNCCTGIYSASSTYDGKEYGVYNATIENNTITNSLCEGILLHNLNDSKVVNNKIENAGSFGILTKKVNNSTLDRNNITNYDIVKVTYHGFAMTLGGMSSSTVSNNSIIVLDKTNYDYRNPITIGANSNNNVFSGNILPSTFKQLYKINSKNNVIQ